MTSPDRRDELEPYPESYRWRNGNRRIDVVGRTLAERLRAETEPVRHRLRK